MANLNDVSLYHAGIAYKIPLGSFFVVQPALSYQVKGASVQDNIAAGSIQAATSTLQTKTGYLELTAGLQAGVDLMAFRPFVLVEPFIGYQLTDAEVYSPGSNTSVTSEELNAYLTNAKNKLEFGFGVGGGVELMEHIQISVQWFMNLGNLYNEGQLNSDAIKSNFVEKYKDIKNYQGIKVSLGLFF